MLKMGCEPQLSSSIHPCVRARHHLLIIAFLLAEPGAVVVKSLPINSRAIVGTWPSGPCPKGTEIERKPKS